VTDCAASCTAPKDAERWRRSSSSSFISTPSSSLRVVAQLTVRSPFTRWAISSVISRMGFAIMRRETRMSVAASTAIASAAASHSRRIVRVVAAIMSASPTSATAAKFQRVLRTNS
jgi:hypothetical protein